MRTTLHLQRGITLYETSVTLAVAAVLASASAQGMDGLLERANVRAAAAEVATDLQQARSLAVARNQALRVRFQTLDGDGSCYVVHTGPTGACGCDASGVASCDGGSEALRTVHHGAAERIRIQANVSSMTYDPRLGTTTPGGRVEVIGRNGLALRHVVSLLGRVRTCAPAGGFNGVPAC